MNKKELALTNLLFIYNIHVSFYMCSKPAQVLMPASFILDLPT